MGSITVPINFSNWSEEDLSFLLNCAFLGSYPSIFISQQISKLWYESDLWDTVPQKINSIIGHDLVPVTDEKKINRKVSERVRNKRDRNAIVAGILSPTGFIPGLVLFGGGALGILARESYTQLISGIEYLQNLQKQYTRKVLEFDELGWLVGKGVSHLKEMSEEDLFLLIKNVAKNYKLEKKWNVCNISSSVNSLELFSKMKQVDEKNFTRVETDGDVGVEVGIGVGIETKNFNIRSEVIKYILNSTENGDKKLFAIISKNLQNHDTRLFIELDQLDYPFRYIQIIDEYLFDSTPPRDFFSDFEILDVDC